MVDISRWYKRRTETWIYGKMKMLRQWGGIVDICPDASPIISKTNIEGLYFNWNLQTLNSVSAEKNSTVSGVCVRLHIPRKNQSGSQEQYNRCVCKHACFLRPKSCTSAFPKAFALLNCKILRRLFCLK